MINKLKHLGPQAKKKFLQLLNASWKTSNIPKTWKKAIKIPILKSGKCRTKAESYRPISLTSSVCKLMEMMVNARLMIVAALKRQTPYARTSGLQAIEIS